MGNITVSNLNIKKTEYALSEGPKIEIVEVLSKLSKYTNTCLTSSEREVGWEKHFFGSF